MVPFRVLSRTNLSDPSRRSTLNSRPLNRLRPLCRREKSQLLWNQVNPASFSKTPGVGGTRAPHPFGISKLQTLFCRASCNVVNAAAVGAVKQHSPGLSAGTPQPHNSSEMPTSHQSQITSHAFSFALCFHNLTNLFPACPLAGNSFRFTSMQIPGGVTQ